MRACVRTCVRACVRFCACVNMLEYAWNMQACVNMLANVAIWCISCVLCAVLCVVLCVVVVCTVLWCVLLCVLCVVCELCVVLCLVCVGQKSPHPAHLLSLCLHTATSALLKLVAQYKCSPQLMGRSCAV